MRRWLVRSLLAPAALCASVAVNAGSDCRALDGDTIRCGEERVRLRDVHAAERGTPGAQAQRRALQRKLDSGEVRIRRHGKDAYGRTLGDVYVGGRKITQADVGPRGGRGTDPAGETRRESRTAARIADRSPAHRAPRGDPPRLSHAAARVKPSAAHARGPARTSPQRTARR